MSVDLPSFHAGELMVKAKKVLFKQDWKQMANGRLDCIEKTFGGVIISTIWAGNHLLLNARKVGYDINSSDIKAYVPLDCPEIEEAKKELIPLFDRIVKRNKRRWDKEIKEYEERRGITFRRNEKYGV